MGEPYCNQVCFDKGRILLELRAARESDLADKLGVSRQTINAIETGKYDPSLPLAFKMAKLWKMPIKDIFDPTGD